jgi:hypothetical protein
VGGIDSAAAKIWREICVGMHEGGDAGGAVDKAGAQDACAGVTVGHVRGGSQKLTLDVGKE